MKFSIGKALKGYFSATLPFFLIALIPCLTKAAGVTIITHGFEESYPTWVTAMADNIPAYFQDRFPGLATNCSTYKLTITKIGGIYYYDTPTRANGSPPFAS